MERKVKISMPDGKISDGFEVPVLESTERWTEIKLEDGSVLRIKPSIIAAIRIPGQYDQEGNPMYVLKATNSMMVAESADIHKKGYLEAQKKTN
jgi:hypothetical protein